MSSNAFLNTWCGRRQLVFHDVFNLADQQQDIDYSKLSISKMTKNKKNLQWILYRSKDLNQWLRQNMKMVMIKIHDRSLYSLWLRRLIYTLDHLAGSSDAWPLREGFDELEGIDPLSWEDGPPHFCSRSIGSTTCTVPSLMPSAIWLGSDGWAAITKGEAELPLQKIFVRFLSRNNTSIIEALGTSSRLIFHREK